MPEVKDLGLKGWLTGRKTEKDTNEAQAIAEPLDKRRIAVLPFVNMSTEPADEYFADGLTEELIDRLCQIRQLDVIARTSILSYKKKDKKAAEIGRELRAGSLVEGSVRKAGKTIRVTAQLINANTETHLWSSRYDESLEDILVAQDNVAERVAEALRVQLLPQEVEAFYVEVLDLSSDGRTALALSNRTGSYQLATVPAEGGGLKELTHGKERVSWARISHNSKQVVFSRDFGGREEHQLFKVPLVGGVEEQIAKLPPIRISDFAWSRKDDRVAFAGATQEYNGLWLLDADAGTFRNVYRCRHQVFGPEWSVNDEIVCFSAGTTEHPTATELIFLAGDGEGEPMVYTPKAGSENSGVKWHPSEKWVLFKTDAGGRYALATYEPGPETLLMLKGADLGLGLDFQSFDWTPDGKSVYYLGSKEGRTRLYVEELESREQPREVPIPEGFHAGFFGSTVKITPDGKNFLFSWSSLSTTPRISRYSIETRRTGSVVEIPANLPIGKAEKAVYESFDGRLIHGWFLKPLGQVRARPCVLWIHGGPASEVADAWNSVFQSFLVSGFLLFAPNIRGSSGYGIEFQNLNIHDVGGADLRDVEEAVKYLRSRPDVDHAKIAIAGASYGGYMTFLAMTKLPQLWAAGAAVEGITDWSETYELSDALFRSFIERYFGKPEENPELYWDRSPINFVEHIKAPLLIWHRANDSRCPLGPVEKFAARLKELGRRYEMEVVWDAGHGLQTTENRALTYKAIVSFLTRELGMSQA